jgi:TolA-binding protein
MQKLSEGAPAQARVAFEAIINDFAADTMAPHTQFQLAETYASEQNFDRAIAEFEKLEKQWGSPQNHPRAPQALLRAGIISQERNDQAKARAFYNAIVQRYPAATEVVEEARRRLPQVR